MVLITGKSDLEGTKWALEDVFTLQRMLTNEEFEENITDDMGDMKRLKVCSQILNERAALPERYKELVKNYQKSDAQIPEVWY
jgi:hypothetical protein